MISPCRSRRARSSMSPGRQASGTSSTSSCSITTRPSNRSQYGESCGTRYVPSGRWCAGSQTTRKVSAAYSSPTRRGGLLAAADDERHLEPVVRRAPDVDGDGHAEDVVHGLGQRRQDAVGVARRGEASRPSQCVVGRGSHTSRFTANRRDYAERGRSTSSITLPSGSRRYSTSAAGELALVADRHRSGRDQVGARGGQARVHLGDIRDPERDVRGAGLRVAGGDRRLRRDLVLDQLEDAAGRQRQVGDAQTSARMSDHGLDLRSLLEGDGGHREPEQPLVERERAIEVRDGDAGVIETQDGHPGGV